MQKNNKSRKRRLAVCLGALALMTAGILTSTLAKYVSDMKTDQNLLEAGRLIFYADHQEGDTVHTSENNMSFSIYNHADDFVTPFDIVYTVTVDNDANVSSSSGELKKNEKDTDEITIQNLSPDKIYNVTVKATTPYEKTINFKISTSQINVPNQYAIKDHGNWVKLDLYIGSTPPETLQINYGSLSPDTLNNLMKDWKQSEDGSGKFSIGALEPFGHYELIFFENDEAGKKNYATVTLTTFSQDQLKINEEDT